MSERDIKLKIIENAETEKKRMRGGIGLKECTNRHCYCNKNSKCHSEEQEKECPRRITKEIARKIRNF